MESISFMFFEGLYFFIFRQYRNMSLQPSKTAYVPSLKIISASISGYLATNMPQTGHLSFSAGVTGFISAATGDAAKTTRQMIGTSLLKNIIYLLNILFFQLFPHDLLKCRLTCFPQYLLPYGTVAVNYKSYRQAGNAIPLCDQGPRVEKHGI